MIENYFSRFFVELIPTDWFTMLDKLYLRIFPKNAEASLRKLSSIHFHIDRKIPPQNRLALFLSGSVITHIKKPITNFPSDEHD